MPYIFLFFFFLPGYLTGPSADIFRFSFLFCGKVVRESWIEWKRKLTFWFSVSFWSIYSIHIAVFAFNYSSILLCDYNVYTTWRETSAKLSKCFVMLSAFNTIFQRERQRDNFCILGLMEHSMDCVHKLFLSMHYMGYMLLSTPRICIVHQTTCRLCCF